jgi:hypothetical protein
VWPADAAVFAGVEDRDVRSVVPFTVDKAAALQRLFNFTSRPYGADVDAQGKVQLALVSVDLEALAIRDRIRIRAT